MSDFYKEFSTTSKEEWIKKVTAELKGRNPNDLLHRCHPIEEIAYLSYGFLDEKNGNHFASDQADFSRSGRFKNNDWINNIYLQKDAPQKMNEFALHFLMNGATGLKLDLANFSSKALDSITKNVDFEYIESTFFYSTKEQFNWLNKLVDRKISCTAINVGEEDFGLMEGAKNRLIKGIDVQYAGGNVTQEIAYALYQGHNVLFQLMKGGLSIDEAATQMKFSFGIGNNFFFELNKFKVFRSLWSSVVVAYKPKDKKSKIPYIEAETGFLNKSLKDPHNNLLRLTTEVLSAVLGGIDEITILPYNLWSSDKNIEKTQRLGLNIGLILKEESYFDKVIDPAGGAYVLEGLYQELRKKSWETFQKMETDGIPFLKEEIQRVADKRLKLINSKENTLIGVNKFFSPNKSDIKWEVNTSTPFGESLILEKECKVEI